jgi:hypothetical protein
VPLPSQVSPPLHLSVAFAHDVPAGAGAAVTPVDGLHVFTMHGFALERSTGIPGVHDPLPSHVAMPAQRSPPHVVPAGAGVVMIPSTGSHVCVAQGVFTRTGGVPARQAPAPSQVSAPLQALPSEHDVPAALGVLRTPNTGSHVWIEHALLVRTGGVPGWQEPLPSHVSRPLQAFPSEHDVPAGLFVVTTPWTGSHVWVLHAVFVSTGGVPATQAPDPLHVSSPLQAFPSEHDVPTGLFVVMTPWTGSHAWVVHAVVTRTGGVPAWQVPMPSQVSTPLHGLPSEHEVPAGLFVVITP